MIPVIGSGIAPLNSSSVLELLPDFTDNYNSATGWTQVGTLVTVDDSNDNEMKMAAVDLTTHNRVHRSIGLTLSDTTWTCDWTFTLSSLAASRRLALIALTDATGEVIAGDTIFIQYRATAGSAWHVNVVTYLASVFGAQTANNDTALTDEQQYYGRLKRTSATTVTCGIYSDAEYGTQVGADLALTVDSGCGGLDVLQHGSDAGGNAAETGTCNVNLTEIYNEVLL